MLRAATIARPHFEFFREAVVALLVLQIVLGGALHAGQMAQLDGLSVGLGAICWTSSQRGPTTPDVPHQDECCSLGGGCFGAALAAPVATTLARPGPIAVWLSDLRQDQVVLAPTRYRSGFAARDPPDAEARIFA